MWKFCWRGLSKVMEKFGAWGGYYSVGFFEEFIVDGEVADGVPIAMGIVFLEEFVEGRCEIRHWRCFRNTVLAKLWQKHSLQ